MAFNLSDPQTKQIVLTEYGGLVTNLSPIALPSGASPDCSDMTFLPGGTFSRPCLHKQLETPLGDVDINYAKSYIDPTGIIRNLYLDSAGNFWVENITDAIGPEILFSTTPATMARSITANGREYVAISDGAHGQEIPLQITGLPNGTVQLDRVTQDGPGAPPSVANLIIAPTQVSASGTPLTLTIVEVDPENPDPTSGFFTSINVYTSSSTAGAQIGDSVVISGTGTPFDGTYGPITGIFAGSPSLIQVSGYTPAGTPFWTGSAMMTINQGAMQRQSNVVTASTTAPNQLQPGYQVQITGALASQVGTGIASIVVDNENNPGIATVTVNLATGQTTHGLVPGNNVSITGVIGVTVGGGIASIGCQGEITSVTTNDPHGLNPGAIINIDGTGTILDTHGVTVAQIISPTIFTYPYAIPNSVVENGSGTVTLVWPVPDTPTPTYFEVIASPTNTTFQVQLSYADGTWTTGEVTFAWDGTFFVQSILPLTVIPETTLAVAITSTAATGITITSGADIADGDTIQIDAEQMNVVSGGGTTSLTVVRGFNATTAATHLIAAEVSLVQFPFTYQQYGPDATASPVSGSITVTPYGQAAPGIHLFAQAFLRRQGGITAPSPWVQVVLNGGQYVNITNLAIGPPDTEARIVLATGAGGAYFFYIPNPPQENGQTIGTATQINDNATTSVILDFADATLLSATGVSTQGNNLANQIVLEGALNFGYYGSRILTIGQRNIIQNLLNMGFDGGYISQTPTLPLGWDTAANVGGMLATGHLGIGFGWSVSVVPTSQCGLLTQSLYQDYSGSPIVTADTPFSMRVWLQTTAEASDLAFVVKMSSASTGFSTTASVFGGQMFTQGSWFQIPFSQNTPVSIPSDLILSIYADSATTTCTLLVDELSLIFGDDPYLTSAYGSYINNPEGIDGVSGIFGPQDDTHPIYGMQILRSDLYLLTLDPNGRLHQTSQGVTEPADWVIDEVASNCGLIGVAAITVSQADDSTASGGEEWFSWYSSDGPRIFGGQSPDKIAQEIQRPAGQTFPGAPPDLGALNINARLTIWALNDPTQKRMWFGIPTGDASTPSVIWHISYIGLDSADAISSRAPVHLSLSGKMVSSDLGRKWAPWQLAMNGGALMYRQAGQVIPIFFAGRMFGNVYALDPDLYTDDDYGAMVPYYKTYALPSRDEEQQQQLGGGQKILAKLISTVDFIGELTFTVYYGTLASAWPLTGSGYLSQPTPGPFDIEWTGGMAQGYRFFIGFSVTPNPAGTTASPTTDVALSITSLTVGLKKARMSERGSYP